MGRKAGRVDGPQVFSCMTAMTNERGPVTNIGTVPEERTRQLKTGAPNCSFKVVWMHSMVKGRASVHLIA